MNKDCEIELTEEDLDMIAPDIDEFINNRIAHKQFARVILWLNARAIKDDFVYSSELANFCRYTRTRAYQVLKDIERIGLLKSITKGNIVEFWFVKNDGHLKIKDYLSKAKRTMGL